MCVCVFIFLFFIFYHFQLLTGLQFWLCQKQHLDFISKWSLKFFYFWKIKYFPLLLLFFSIKHTKTFSFNEGRQVTFVLHPILICSLCFYSILKKKVNSLCIANFVISCELKMYTKHHRRCSITIHPMPIYLGFIKEHELQIMDNNFLLLILISLWYFIMYKRGCAMNSITKAFMELK